ncbi:hypothetical protein BD626DRAFT_533808 [Schizophyllum amplum]|uniref:F-box domain-containing protein n=1 Tax=Schizophyllum amplum TaxID=97359 RepID=A0A550D0S1_9AGAR|nr:hypothetical protein BD626DRAFT_533808 [Auriculariopsis ampla]
MEEITPPGKCPVRLCRLPFELQQALAAQLAAEGPHDLDALSQTCDHLKAVLSTHSARALCFREVFDAPALQRRTGWLSAERAAHAPPASPQSLTGIHVRPVHLSGQLQVYYDTIRAPIVNKIPVTDPDADTAMVGAHAMLVLDDGRNASMLNKWGAYEYAIEYILARIRTDRQPRTPEQAARGTCSWPSRDDELTAAFWTLWLLSTPERIAAEPPETTARLMDGLLPYIIIPFRYASGEIPPEYFYPPRGVGPESRYLPQSIATVHGNYPVFPRTQSSAWHYAGYVFDYVQPLLSMVAKLHYFVRLERTPMKISEALASILEEDYPTRLARHRELHGNNPLEPLNVQMTKADINELNANKSTPVPYQAGQGPPPAVLTEPFTKAGLPFTRSMGWDTDGARSIMSRTVHTSFDPASPPSSLAESVRLGLMYRPGTLEGLWLGRMLIPDIRELRPLLDMPERPADSRRLNFLTMQPVVFRLQEFTCGIACDTDGRLPGHDDPRTGWLPPSTRLRVSDDGKHCDAVLNDGRRFRYRSVNEPVDEDNCAGCRTRERVRIEGMERVFSTHGLGLEEQGKCDHCGEERRQPSKDFLYAFGRPPREDDTWEAAYAGQEDSEDEDEETMDVERNADPCAGHRRRVTPPRALKECCHTSSILLVGSTDEHHAAAYYDWVFYGRVRSCDGMVGLLRFPNDHSQYAAHSGFRNHTFFYGYVVGGRNFVGNWRHVFPEGTVGPMVLGENGDIGGGGEGGAEIFWEGPFSCSKVDEPSTADQTAN